MRRPSSESRRIATPVRLLAVPARPAARWLGLAAVCGTLFLLRSAAVAHGNVTPQPVDVKDLPKLEGPLTTNPYRGTPAE